MERATLLCWLVDELKEGYEQQMALGYPPYEDERIPKFTEARNGAIREVFFAPGVIQQLYEYAGLKMSDLQVGVYRSMGHPDFQRAQGGTHGRD
jgi:hypothetical protein